VAQTEVGALYCDKRGVIVSLSAMTPVDVKSSASP
jgi:hypothetical protein